MALIAVKDAHTRDRSDARDGGSQHQFLAGRDAPHRNMRNQRIDSRDGQRAGIPVRAGGVVEKDLDFAIHRGSLNGSPHLLPGRYAVRAFNGLAYSQLSIVDVKEGDNINLTFNYDLLQPDKVYAYPNPAAGVDHAKLHFETAGQDIDAEINIFTISGELVKTAGLAQCTVNANLYEYNWDLKNDNGQKIASGVYIFSVKVRNKADGERAAVTKKFAVVR